MDNLVAFEIRNQFDSNIITSKCYLSQLTLLMFQPNADTGTFSLPASIVTWQSRTYVIT